MMQRLLSFLMLLTCLSLLSCDKQRDALATEERSVTERKAIRVRQTSDRKEAHQPSELLREKFNEVLQIESQELRAKEIANIAWNAVDIDPDLASEAFFKLPVGSADRKRLVWYYAMRLAENDVEQALDWSATLESESEVFAAKCQIAQVMAEKDPRAAANLLSQSGLEGREMDAAVVQVIQRWVAQSPPDAAAWVELFPPGAARETGIKVVAEQWLLSDAAAAFAWFDVLNDSIIRAETARAMEGVILLQPESVRKAWLQHADARIQNELEQQRVDALREVGIHIPQSGP